MLIAVDHGNKQIKTVCGEPLHRQPRFQHLLRNVRNLLSLIIKQSHRQNWCAPGRPDNLER